MTPKAAFFLAFLARSGSTHLMHLLDQQEGVSCQGEVFSARHATSGGRYDTDAKVLRRFGSILEQAPIAGFKFEANKQAKAFPLVGKLLEAIGAKCVLLDRRDLLKCYISGELSRQVQEKTGLGVNLKGGWSVKLDPIFLDPDDAKAAMMRRRDVRREMLETFPRRFDTLQIEYEDLVADREHELQRVAKFLGFSGTLKLGETTKKIAPPNLSDVIVNYPELLRVARDIKPL